jgi:Spy/CpxP family protein refolding chaperone
MGKQAILLDKDNKNDMKKQLISGQFNSKDALQLLTEMIHVKIRFHENKINHQSNEEDIKMREKRIQALQKDLFEIRKEIEKSNGNVEIHAELNIVKK